MANGGNTMCPINIKNYPSNWKEIAKACKDKANWTCEYCGIQHVTIRLTAKGFPYKEIMTTAHVGANKYDKMECSDLKCLCTRCHLREDLQEHIKNRKRSRALDKLRTQPELPFE